MNFFCSSIRWGLTGFILIVLHLFVYFLSQRFSYTQSALQEPVWTFVTIQFIAGALYLILPLHIRHCKSTKSLILWIVAAGVIMRLCLMPSTPILEDDYYRYIWDGSVLSKGFNPYAYSPDQLMFKTESPEPIPFELRELAVESGIIIERVNHPQLRTIYPPIAQLSFMIASFIKPWSLIAWKIVLFFYDSLTVFFIFILLKKMKVSPLWIALYWWNPLLIKEIYNSGHMDVILLPFIVGALIMFVRESHYKASFLLACAVGVKVWPVLLFPLFLRPFLRNIKKIILLIAAFIFPIIVMALPIYMTGFDRLSGFTAYSQHWQMNDALFMTFVWGAEFVLRILGLVQTHAQMVTRTGVMIILVFLIIYLNRTKAYDIDTLLERTLIITAALFILSPTQFPWYYVWILPFLALRPRYSLLTLTPFLSLYYLRFYYSAQDKVAIFDNYIVWIEYVPLWCLLLWQWYRHSQGQDGTLLSKEA